MVDDRDAKRKLTWWESDERHIARGRAMVMEYKHEWDDELEEMNRGKVGGSFALTRGGDAPRQPPRCGVIRLRPDSRPIALQRGGPAQECSPRYALSAMIRRVCVADSGLVRSEMSLRRAGFTFLPIAAAALRNPTLPRFVSASSACPARIRTSRPFRPA